MVADGLGVVVGTVSGVGGTDDVPDSAPSATIGPELARTRVTANAAAIRRRRDPTRDEENVSMLALSLMIMSPSGANAHRGVWNSCDISTQHRQLVRP
ncbi:MAG: hypothetical protein CSA55_01200 [Ilumatobacter coccineus]|uniref:Uncharacterized protein n=1 Tax=Ilumatobacter coccineus TaxID=467094 RepID=A0A2G6KEZ0_9ACTN|nr:MAG: hypothetical protein CSA55_01200 [Ilumatobacter coccineus]